MADVKTLKPGDKLYSFRYLHSKSPEEVTVVKVSTATVVVDGRRRSGERIGNLEEWHTSHQEACRAHVEKLRAAIKSAEHKIELYTQWIAEAQNDYGIIPKPKESSMGGDLDLPRELR